MFLFIWIGIMLDLFKLKALIHQYFLIALLQYTFSNRVLYPDPSGSELQGMYFA